MKIKIYAMLAVAGLLFVMFFYAKEFVVFSNTIGIRGLVTASLLTGALAAFGLLFAWRQRLTPWDRHYPEAGMVVICCLVFMPLVFSLLNRLPGASTYESFEFVSETPYFASGYGFLITESSPKPTGWRLRVRQRGREYHFQYKKQPYFPITRPGEPVLLPVRKGILGARVIELR